MRLIQGPMPKNYFFKELADKLKDPELSDTNSFYFLSYQ